MNRTIALVGAAGVAAVAGFLLLRTPPPKPQSDFDKLLSLTNSIVQSATANKTSGSSPTARQRQQQQIAANLRAQQAADAANRLLTQPRVPGT